MCKVSKNGKQKKAGGSDYEKKMESRYQSICRSCTYSSHFIRLRQQNSLVTEKILFMLEGAIIGIHEAALPVARRQELAEWADSLTPKQEFPAELE